MFESCVTEAFVAHMIGTLKEKREEREDELFEESW